MKPILYLDVEGTLLLCGAGRAFFRPGLEELLAFVHSQRGRMECLWLTSYSRQHLERLFAPGGPSIEGIGYQQWGACKAAALSVDAPVLWVDDRITEGDRAALEGLAGGAGRVSYRPIRRWDGNPADSELQALQLEIEAWLQRQAGREGAEGCSRVA